MKEVDEFQSFEIELLDLIIGEQKTNEQNVPICQLVYKMKKAGFDEISFGIGIHMLQAKQLLVTYVDQDWTDNDYNACKLTDKGVDFILNNIGLFRSLKKRSGYTPDNLPF